MQMLNNVGAMSWQQWLRGAGYAAVHGAGQGLLTFAIGIPLKKALIIVAGGIILGLGAYLQGTKMPGENGVPK